MQKILPIIVICSVGLAVCLGLLLFYFVRFVVRRIKRRREVFELDENTLTIHLDKKHFGKH